MYKGWNNFKEKIIGLKGLAAIGSADVIGSGISAIFWLYLASLINPENYGEIHYYLGIAGVASYISLVGAQNTIIVYSAKNVKIQPTLNFISLIVGTISSLTIIFIFYRIDAGIVLLGYIINTLAIGDLLGKRLYSNYTKYVLVQKILTLVLGIGFFYIFGVDGVIYALAISYIFYIIRIYRVFKESKINFTLLKPRVGFIANNYVMSLIGGFSGQIDKIIIVPLLGFTILGNYSLALQVVAVLMVFSGFVFKYLLPQDSIKNQNIKLRKISIFVSGGIAVLSIILSPHIIPTLFPNYVQVVDAIQIMNLGVISGTITILYTSKFLGLEKSKFVLIGSLLSLITIVIGIILLGDIYGITGIAVAFVLSSSVNAVFLTTMNRIIKLK